MKKFILIFTFIFLNLICNFNFLYVDAKQENTNSDEIINNIIDGINEDNFKNIIDEINDYFNENKTFKDWLILFINGELNLDFQNLKECIKNIFLEVTNNYSNTICIILFLIITHYIINIVFSKNNDNNEKNTIYFIFYFIVITILTQMAFNIFKEGLSVINNTSKIIQTIFPVMFSILSLVGNFGVNLLKPIILFITYFISTIIEGYFIPILSLSLTTITIGNVNNNVKLNNLSKSLLSLFKWSLGIVSIIFTAFVTVSTIVNAGYNGVSVKVLKYATGSLIPIVGGFLSGSMDVFLTSAILLKNSIGLLGAIYLIFTIFKSAISILIFSFITKILVSVCEPISDKRFTSVIIGITDIFNYLSSLILLSGFMCFLALISLILSTISVI